MNAISATHSNFDLLPPPDEALWRRLAREVAKDIVPIDEILKHFAVTKQAWAFIFPSPIFQRMLTAEIEQWNSADGTMDRVKLKALVMIEEVLPEMFAKMLDPRENLTAKTEVFKNIAKIAEVGQTSTPVGAGGERFSVTINLGNAKPIVIDQQLPQQVIESDDFGSEEA